MGGTKAQAKKEKQTELSAIHDFAGKLRQPEILPRLKQYVRFQIEARRRHETGRTLDELIQTIDDVPISINLDLTTSCNYACDHCVDMDILNTGIRYEDDKLRDSLANLAERGLKSVIVIGGGEPTVYPKFEEMILYMKELGLKVGIVTNGSFMGKIEAVAHELDEYDWVRLSLDSGSDEIFQAMHKPRRPIHLDEICAGVPPVKAKNDVFPIGYSFIIVWEDCEANDTEIHENIHEIYMAAERARKYDFDYISYKPFLTRAERNNAEIVELTQEETAVDPIMERIRNEVDRAKKLATDGFKVYESTNLKVLENGTFRNYTQQPKQCHMQFFRQVLSPLGLYNCPVYRHVPQAKVGHKHSYSSPEKLSEAQGSTLRLIENFNATDECKEVTCLYNHVNWYIEDLIENPHKLDELEAGEDRKDFFL